ncbi:pilus assembly protein TadG-related protein [Fulvimarina sp. MAC8]|uniref:TadE/TadG family type IV pilus assembly protein n=1 Tax=Fulvimarina sp. MAC8 TaxID=3162874 RepID=UPI0032F07C3C
MRIGHFKSEAIRRSRALCRERDGSTSIIAALVVPVLVAAIGFGVETGLWYAEQRGLQHAADVAVHAAALRKNSGADEATMRAAAHYVAAQSGFTVADDVFRLDSPAVTGPHAGEEGTVELRVSITQERLFSAIIDDTPTVLGARAVARIDQQSNACILALAPTASGAVSVGGSTEITLDGCEIAANSNASDSFDMFGEASLTTGCIQTVGQAMTTGGLDLTECESVREHAAPVSDPYRTVPEPALSGSCEKNNVGHPNKSTTLTPTENHASGVKVMRFCDGLAIKGPVKLEPGLYIVENGDVTMNGGASIEGSGVTIYLTNNARMKLTGNGDVNLSAPTSGPYSGLLVFGGRDQTGIEHKIAGTTDSVMQGAIYLPASDVEYRGNSALSDACTQIIANTIDFNGNSSLGAKCEAAGGRDIVSKAAVTIIE